MKFKADSWGKSIGLAIVAAAGAAASLGCGRSMGDGDARANKDPLFDPEIVSIEPEIDRLTKIGSELLAIGQMTKSYEIEVPDDAISLTIVVDGGSASDIDIANVVSPSGARLVNNASGIYPFGYTSALAFGQSALGFSAPYNANYTFEPGAWRFNARHAASSDGQARELTLYYHIKTKPGRKMDLNFFIVAIEDCEGPDDANMARFIEATRIAIRNLGLELGQYDIYNLTSDKARELSIVDPELDSDRNGNPDDMDELFMISSIAENERLNVFLVNRFAQWDYLGIAGGISGPMGLQGTRASGVAINSFGSLEMLARYATAQAETVAHEIGHYIGLTHTTESNGRFFDSISDTPECPVDEYDADGDGILSFDECRDHGALNLMFWAADLVSPRDISPEQRMVFSLSPITRSED